MQGLSMHYLDVGRCEIADTFECRAYILDWIEENGHKIRRVFDGMFSPADSASALLQVLGIDSHMTGMSGKPRQHRQLNSYSELARTSGFIPFQAFCYEDEIETLIGLVETLARRFPFNIDAFERGEMGIPSALADISSYESPLPKDAYLASLSERAPRLRDRLEAAFPSAYESAAEELARTSGASISSMSEDEIRARAGQIIEEKVSAEVFEEGISAVPVSDAQAGYSSMGRLSNQRLSSTIATWLALSDEKHVVEGLREVMEDPFAVLMSLSYRGGEDEEIQERIDAPLRQDSMLRGYMATYIYALLFGFRCVRLPYDDYLYDLYSSRMWETFALCGKGYVRGGAYERLAELGMRKLGYPTSEKTLESVVTKLNRDILNNRGEDD